MNTILKEFNENENIATFDDSENKEIIANYQTKTLEEYDRDINAAVKKLYPEIFQGEVE